MTTRRLQSIAITVIGLLLVASIADARPRHRPTRSLRKRTNKSARLRVRQHQNPAAQQVPVQERLTQLEGTTNFTRGGKLHVAVKTEAGRKALNRLPNTVEFFVKKGYGHLYVRVKDVAFDRHMSVKATKWSDFNYKDKEQSGVLLELPRPLYKQFVKHLSAAKRDPKGTVGTFEYNGGKFPEQSNCTSWVTLAKMGGDRLVKALGVPRDAKGIGDANPTRHPQSWINALIDHSPYTKAVIMRNHEKTGKDDAKIDLSQSGRNLVR
mgnify:CR=1 FL=1